jgi:4-hydroxy-tetrahydrodipicolinate synthase
MKDHRLSGVIVPVITPVDEMERVDESAFRKALRRLIKVGVNGIFVGGSAGEGPLLSASAWRRMMETACDEVGDQVALLGGVSDTSTVRVVEKIEILRSIGFRRFVLTPTFYLSLKTEQEHIRLFGRARDAGGDMEMIAYNIPQCVGSSLPVEWVCEMARRGWIRCCKESSGDMPYLKRLIAQGAECGLDVLVGDEPSMAEGLQAGGKGIVPVCANFDPALFLRTIQAAMNGNRAELQTLQQRILDVRNILVVAGPCWLAGIKYSLSALGIGNGKPVSPLEPPPKEQVAKIDELIRREYANA